MALANYIEEFDILSERKSELLNEKLKIDEELGTIKHKLKVNEIKIHKLI